MTTKRWHLRFVAVVASLLLSSQISAAQGASETISIDASCITGTIKRVNDVDNGPLCQHGLVDLSRYYRELGIRNVLKVEPVRTRRYPATTAKVVGRHDQRAVHREAITHDMPSKGICYLKLKVAPKATPLTVTS